MKEKIWYLCCRIKERALHGNDARLGGVPQRLPRVALCKSTTDAGKMLPWLIRSLRCPTPVRLAKNRVRATIFFDPVAGRVPPDNEPGYLNAPNKVGKHTAQIDGPERAHVGPQRCLVHSSAILK
jgi:hypothetical protein